MKFASAFDRESLTTMTTKLYRQGKIKSTMTVMTEDDISDVNVDDDNDDDDDDDDDSL